MSNSVARLLAALLLLLSLASGAAAFSLEQPQARGLALNLGSSYDPSPTFGFTQLSMMALYDYEQIWNHAAPEALRFKFEGSLGVADDSQVRLMASANIFALYYLERLRTVHLYPYVEAGIGLVYDDFQVEGQGLRINFNPQAGIGVQLNDLAGHDWYTALRGYHISNGHLHHDNRGINAVMLQLGLLF